MIKIKDCLNMNVICTKCGCTNVACEAMINPNNKEFINYTDESFLYGWCENCNTGVILSDTDEIQAEIQQKYDTFVKENGKEPAYAVCDIVWKDNNDLESVKIQLSADSNPDEDDDFFFYCNGLNDLKSLCDFGSEDFIVTEIDRLENND